MRLYDDINYILTIFMDRFIQDKEINGCENQAKSFVNFRSSFLLLLMAFLKRHFRMASLPVLFEGILNAKNFW